MLLADLPEVVLVSSVVLLITKLDIVKRNCPTGNNKRPRPPALHLRSPLIVGPPEEGPFCYVGAMVVRDPPGLPLGMGAAS